MSIKIIYGNSHCSKCKATKEKYPEVEYIEIDKLNYEEKIKLRELIKSKVKESSITYPICFDEKGDIVYD
ncbi:MAG TPA: hypothetical protein VGB37_04045 [Candidatus Lokiarchaeia archaeon]